MAEATPEHKQAKLKEFMTLLPLTVEIAGLAQCPPDRAFTPDQMEARVIQIRLAYKAARAMLNDLAAGG